MKISFAHLVLPSTPRGLDVDGEEAAAALRVGGGAGG